MKAEIGVWKIDRRNEPWSATELDRADKVDTEERLEDILASNPTMLMRGLTLVGRQVPTGAGQIDLLGIDEEGRLTVFELKREKLTRDAVAQILDYCSFLESLSDSELGTLISEQSGKHGFKKIADFQEWYASQAGESLTPVRMVLVSLGIDLSAQRIVDYLAERDIDISLLTFHGYLSGENMLLAKQVQVVDKPLGNLGKIDLDRKASEYGVEALWQDARDTLNYSIRTYYTKSGITYLQRTITLPEDVRVRGSHAVVIEDCGRIRVTLYPAAVDLGREQFELLKTKIQFTAEVPPNAPATRDAPEQHYCSLDEASWQKGKTDLVNFLREVEDVWRARELSARTGLD